MSWSPHFDVVGFLRSKSNITGAEFDDLIVQTEFLKGRFGMAGEFFENGERLVGMDYLDDFDFIELVHANDAPVVTSGTPGLATKTGSLAGHLNREISFREKSVAEEIGQGHFSGGNEEHFVVLDTIHVVFKLGELGRANHTLAFHNVRDINLFVAVFTRLEIEKILNESSL